ncbi:hypothetical protein U1Q18_037338 [Sarracenia purpurea var. burkii]
MVFLVLEKNCRGLYSVQSQRAIVCLFFCRSCSNSSPKLRKQWAEKKLPTDALSTGAVIDGEHEVREREKQRRSSSPPSPAQSQPLPSDSSELYPDWFFQFVRLDFFFANGGNSASSGENWFPLGSAIGLEVFFWLIFGEKSGVVEKISVKKKA